MPKKVVSISLGLLFFALVFSLHGESVADDPKVKVKKIKIEKGYHHLGDSFVSDFLIPDPEGFSWETTVKLDRSILKKYETAFAKFYCHGIDYSFLVVNEYRIRLNKQNNENPQIFNVCIVPIPVDFLNEKENTIGIEADDGGTKNYDDMEFGELEIWFQ
jgi:hypothetical protein